MFGPKALARIVMKALTLEWIESCIQDVIAYML